MIRLAPADAPSAPASWGAEFAAAARILTGFDRSPQHAGWQAGDRLLYGVRLEKDGSSRTWYVLIRVVRTGVQPGTQVSLDASECEQDDSAIPLVDASPTTSPDGSPAASGSRTRVAAQPMAAGTLVAPAASELPAEWKARELSPQLSFALLHIDVYDEHASAIASTHQFLSENFADTSLYQSCAVALRCVAAGEKPTAAEMQQAGLGLSSFFALGRLLYATPHIGNIMGEITPSPSLISILLHRGVRVDLWMQFPQATAADRDWPALAGGRAAYRLPFDISLNDEPALHCCVIAAEAEPPLRLCSGIIGLEGTNVRRPEHKFTVRLVAARLGGRSDDARDGE